MKATKRVLAFLLAMAMFLGASPAVAASSDPLARPPLADYVRLPGDYSLADLPARWDARDYGWVTPIRRQVGEICWSYAGIAAVETAALRQGYGPLDLSETYYGYYQASDPYYMSDYSTADGKLLPYLSGSGAYTVFHGLSRRFGPVTEAQFPEGRWDAIDPALLHIPPCLAVQGYIIVPGMNQLQHKYCPAEVLISIAKRAIMECGAMAIKVPDHAICAVGWDDNFYTAGETGAFICKNSWGEERDLYDYTTINGYVYLPYSVLTDWPQSGMCAVTRIDSADHYDHAVFASQTAPGNYDGTWITGSTVQDTRVFETGNAAQILRAMSFHLEYFLATREINASYEVYVQPDCKGQPDMDKAILAATGKVNNFGFYTIDFAQPFPIAANSRYAITLKYTNCEATNVTFDNFFSIAAYTDDVETRRYTVTYESDRFSPPSHQQVAQGSAVSLPSSPAWSKDYEYDFLGWNTTPIAAGPLKSLKMPGQDITLYPVFREYTPEHYLYLETSGINIEYLGSVKLWASQKATWGGGNKYIQVNPQTGEVKSVRGFIKNSSAVITATAGGQTVHCTVSVKPTVQQWIMIIFLFGWIWM